MTGTPSGSKDDDCLGGEDSAPVSPSEKSGFTSHLARACSLVLATTLLALAIILFCPSLSPGHELVPSASAQSTVSLDAPQRTMEGAPGSILNYSVNINGTGLDSPGLMLYTIFTPDEGIMAWVSSPYVSASSSGDISSSTQVLVKLPSAAESGSHYNVTLAAGSPFQPLSSMVLTAGVINSTNARVTASPNITRIASLSTANFTLNITNTGSVRTTYDIYTMGIMIPGVSVSFSANSVTLGPGESIDVMAVINANTILSSTSDFMFTVSIMDTSGTFSKAVPIDVIVEPLYWASPNPSSIGLNISPGSTQDFEIRMVNGGATAAYMNCRLISDDGSTGFNITLENSSATVQAGESSIVMVHVSLDGNIDEGTFRRITFMTGASSGPTSVARGSPFILDLMVTGSASVSASLGDDTVRTKAGSNFSRTLSVSSAGNGPVCVWLPFSMLSSYTSPADLPPNSTLILGPGCSFEIPMTFAVPDDAQPSMEIVKIAIVCNVAADPLSTVQPPGAGDEFVAVASFTLLLTTESNIQFTMTPSVKEIPSGTNSSFLAVIFNAKTVDDFVQLHFEMNASTMFANLTPAVVESWLYYPRGVLTARKGMSSSFTLNVNVPKWASPGIFNISCKAVPGGLNASLVDSFDIQVIVIQPEGDAAESSADCITLVAAALFALGSAIAVHLYIKKRIYRQ